MFKFIDIGIIGKRGNHQCPDVRVDFLELVKTIRSVHYRHYHVQPHQVNHISVPAKNIDRLGSIYRSQHPVVDSSMAGITVWMTASSSISNTQPE